MFARAEAESRGSKSVRGVRAEMGVEGEGEEGVEEPVRREARAARVRATSCNGGKS